MAEYLKQFNVGGAVLTFHGLAVTEDDLGERIFHRCGMLWDPREFDGGKTTETKVGIIVQGDCGPNVTITICEGWAGRDRKISTILEPFFRNDRDQIKRYASKSALFVVIEGVRETETWIVSWWRMPSRRTFFDLAKNQFRAEEIPGRCQTATEPEHRPENGNGHEETPQLAEVTPEEAQQIAAEQAAALKPNGRQH